MMCRDRKLADQLRLVEAVTLTLGREVGEPVQRQPGIRALASLPLDRLPARRAAACAAAMPAVFSGIR